jgi:hypothetical protein
MSEKPDPFAAVDEPDGDLADLFEGKNVEKTSWAALSEEERALVRARDLASQVIQDIDRLYEKSVRLRAEYEKLVTPDGVERRKQNAAAMLTALRLVRHLARTSDNVGFDCPKCGHHVLEVKMVPERGACAIRVGGEVCCENVAAEFLV